MPTLPGFELSEPHFIRVVAAFPGSTNEEKLASYNNWLANRLIDRVMEYELQQLHTTMESERRSRVQAVLAALPTRPPDITDSPNPGPGGGPDGTPPQRK